MKNTLFTLILVLISLNTGLAQVGIGTIDPKTTLQIEGEPTTTTTADGVRAPMLTLAELDAKISAYGSDQDGVIVYINDVSSASTETETANITKTGYHYYDASNDVWRAMAKEPTTYSLGDFAQGGIVFWVDETGQHGLVAAKEDQSTGIQWNNGTDRYTGSIGDGLYAGAMNTAMIVATQMADNQTGNFAAKVCADYSVTTSGVTYGDWYLPSRDELNKMYSMRSLINNTATSNGGSIFFTGSDSKPYWSSTESTNIFSRSRYFSFNFQLGNSKSNLGRVRCIRAL
ncbi:Lcl domain-containing protein [Psychroflexus planctonicus]|nr:DUF1566 domain-containing protein [Psychroflexus planctonicus]